MDAESDGKQDANDDDDDDTDTDTDNDAGVGVGAKPESKEERTSKFTVRRRPRSHPVRTSSHTLKNILDNLPPDAEENLKNSVWTVVRPTIPGAEPIAYREDDDGDIYFVCSYLGQLMVYREHA
jgi:glycine/D-amino acid oxidase-like deaminating enzyme